MKTQNSLFKPSRLAKSSSIWFTNSLQSIWKKLHFNMLILSIWKRSRKKSKLWVISQSSWKKFRIKNARLFMTNTQDYWTFLSLSRLTSTVILKKKSQKGETNFKGWTVSLLQGYQRKVPKRKNSSEFHRSKRSLWKLRKMKKKNLLT